MLWQTNGVKMNYRNPKLLKLAKDAPCVLCGSNDGTVVACHSNQLRDKKGTGIKSHDYRICYCCHKHHVMMDSSNELTREERINLWEDAHRRTIGWLFENGHLEVK
jgi:hypothetical protein